MMLDLTATTPTPRHPTPPVDEILARCRAGGDTVLDASRSSYRAARHLRCAPRLRGLCGLLGAGTEIVGAPSTAPGLQKPAPSPPRGRAAQLRERAARIAARREAFFGEIGADNDDGAEWAAPARAAGARGAPRYTSYRDVDAAIEAAARATQSVLDALAATLATFKATFAAPDVADECAICTSTRADCAGELLTCCNPKCSALFCRECVDRWTADSNYRRQPRCTHCRVTTRGADGEDAFARCPPVAEVAALTADSPKADLAALRWEMRTLAPGLDVEAFFAGGGAAAAAGRRSRGPQQRRGGGRARAAGRGNTAVTAAIPPPGRKRVLGAITVGTG